LEFRRVLFRSRRRRAQFMYASNAVNMLLDRFAMAALNFPHLPSQMEGCTRWFLITWFSASEGPTPRFSTVRLLKHRFRKMLPELSGARSVAPQGQTFGAMSCLLTSFGLALSRPYQ